jgi:hypothetical protein
LSRLALFIAAASRKLPEAQALAFGCLKKMRQKKEIFFMSCFDVKWNGFGCGSLADAPGIRA